MDAGVWARALERGGMVGVRTVTILLSGTLAAAALSACAESLTGPVCTPGVFDTASTSGDTITTSTGLRYIDDSVGTGAPLPWCRLVQVHYDGYLLDGTRFDSSRDIDRPLLFTPGIGALIDGFEQGVIGMQLGGTRRLIIPPELGYGSEPVRDQNGTIIIPANSTVVFDVEVLGTGP
jgi:peptidylprolyl isomerase